LHFFAGEMTIFCGSDIFETMIPEEPPDSGFFYLASMVQTQRDLENIGNYYTNHLLALFSNR
jgi:hypothetical protein